jgi:hypothetical protein
MRRSHRFLILLAGLLALLIVSSMADPALPGDPFPDPNSRQPDPFWFSRNSISLYHEQFEGDNQIYLWGYPSWATRDFRVWAPRLSYRWRNKVWIDAGTLRNDTDPFISPLTFQGGRLDLDMEPYRLSAGVGQTSQESIPRILQGQPEFNVDHVSLLRRLGDYGWARLSTSGWHPKGPSTALYPEYLPPDDSRVVSVDLAPDLRGVSDNLRVRGGYGVELAGPKQALPDDLRAYSWDLSWYRPSFRFDARQNSQGRAYGPGHFENFQRGQASLNASASLDLSQSLHWRESFDRFVFAQPLESGSRSSNENDTFSHELFYQPTAELSASALLSHSTNKLNPAGTLVQTGRVQLRGDWQAAPNLRLGVAHFDIDTSSEQFSTSTSRTDLRADWWLDPNNRVTGVLGMSSAQGLSVDNQGLDIGLGYEHLLDDDRGHIGFDYRRSRYGFSEQAYQSYQLGFSLYPDPRWRIGGNCAIFDTGVDSKTSASVELSYLVNEHQEIGLTFEQRPFLLYPELPELNLGYASVGLQLRQSFNGPTQKRFASRLRPEVRVLALAENPDQPGQTYPLAGARIRVDGELAGRTGADGTARLRLARGTHQVQLDTQEAGPHYTVVEAPPAELELGEADRINLGYRAIAYSGVRIVTWNDFFGEGEMPVGYVPVSSVPLLVDGQPQRTDQQGQLLLDRLAPGKHTVVLSSQGLPAGMEIMGAAEHEVLVEPGQEAVLPLALRGFAEVRGRVSLAGPLKVPRMGLAVTANGREIGRTDQDGSFLLKAPVGHIELGVDTGELGPRAFLPSGPLRLSLQPGGQATAELSVSMTARLIVRLFSGGNPLDLEGVPITLDGVGFRYSDAQGSMQFPDLKPSTYKVIVDSKAFPEGLELIGAAERTVQLSPGEDKELRIEVKR